MNKLFNLAALTGAVFLVCLGSMVLTAQPAEAQNQKPPADVRVVNGRAEPIPMSLEGKATVDIGNTPSVNISNTPNVAVSSLPAVQIENSANKPLSVVVSNPCAEECAPEPVRLSVDLILPRDEPQASETAYVVPAGKRLVIDFVSFQASSSGEDYLVTLRAGPDTIGFFTPESQAGDVQSCAEMTQMFLETGETLDVTVRRIPLPASTPPFKSVSVRMTGHLYDVPLLP